LFTVSLLFDHLTGRSLRSSSIMDHVSIQPTTHQLTIC
jgi:hypothetical protein